MKRKEASVVGKGRWVGYGQTGSMRESRVEDYLSLSFSLSLFRISHRETERSMMKRQAS